MDGLNEASRDGRGRWAPGQSGNPGGKRPGTRNHATRLRELLAEGDEEVAIKVLMDQVRAGNGVAARFVLDRLFPKPRDREIDLALPPPEAGTTVADVLDRVLWLMAAGEITIDEASRITRLIEARRPRIDAARERPRAAGVSAAAAASPASDLHPAGDVALDADAPAELARPLNRHERRRAAALARTARPPTPLPAAA
jgi:hypothetical protein